MSRRHRRRCRRQNFARIKWILQTPIPFQKGAILKQLKWFYMFHNNFISIIEMRRQLFEYREYFDWSVATRNKLGNGMFYITKTIILISIISILDVGQFINNPH